MTAPERSVSRRALFTTGGLVAAASLGGAAVAAAGSGGDAVEDPSVQDISVGGAESVPFHGVHQAGIDTHPVQAHVRFVALDLKSGAGRDEVRRLMRLLSDDAARMTAGAPPLAAEDPQLPRLPSRLTVTFGFGPGVFDAIGRGGDCPEVIRNLPAFATDRLEPGWNGGDLLLQVCSDDVVPLSYAVRRLVRDARDLATVRWSQAGFNPARGTEPAGTTARNLMGQRTARPTRSRARPSWTGRCGRPGRNG